MDLDSLLNILRSKKVEYDLATKRILRDKIKMKQSEKQLTTYEKTKAFINELAKEAQKESIEFIEKITTSCVQLYGEEWSFEIEVKEMRDQQEFHLWLKEGDIKHYIKDNSLIAGGIYDMTALGLRLAVHALDPLAEPILFLDEPFKNVGNRIEQAGELIKEISRQLKLQVVIITHDEELMAIADTTVKLDSDKPYLERIKPKRFELRK